MMNTQVREPSHKQRTKVSSVIQPYEAKARLAIKQALWSRGLTYRNLAELLTNKGYPHTKVSLTNKISRGTFSAGFLVLCLDVITGQDVS